MNKFRGSYTIEAALVIPFVGLIFLILMYTAFLYYDAATLENRCRISLQSESGELPTDDALFFVDSVTYTQSDGGMDYHASLVWPLGVMNELTGHVEKISQVDMRSKRCMREWEDLILGIFDDDSEE